MITASVVIEQLIVLIAHAIAGIYSSNLKYNKKVTISVWSLWIVFQAVVWYFGEFVIDHTGIKFFSVFVSSFVLQYVIFFATTKGRFLQRLFTILTYSIFFCIFMAFETALQGTFLGAHIIFRVLIHTLLMAGVLCYFLKCVCPLCHVASKTIVKEWYQLVFVDVIFLITLVATSLFPTKITSIYVAEFVPFLFLSISMLAVYPVMFSNIKNMAEIATKRETEQQNKFLVLQIEKEKLQMAQEHMAIHDRRHHNLVLLKYANNNDLESVKEYLKTLVEKDSSNFSESNYCQNTTINTVLSVYEKKAKDAGVTVKISACAGCEIPVSPNDLVIVIANLFENAINATTMLKSKDKVIDIDIREKKTRLLVKIENPCKANLKFDETDYGVGIHSVIATTEKYEGMYDFIAEGGQFSSKICLNY